MDRRLLHGGAARLQRLRLAAAGAFLVVLIWGARGWLHAEAPRAVGEAAPLDIRPGDIVLRRGHDLASAVVLASDPASRFSHSGIVVRIGALPAIVHVLPQDSPPGTGRVLIEPFSEFASPENASEIAVYRFADPDSRIPAEASRVALTFFREERPFDDGFRLDTPTSLYCTELVWRAFLAAGMDLVDGRFKHLSLPLKKGVFILPSTLAESPHLSRVHHHYYDKNEENL